MSVSVRIDAPRRRVEIVASGLLTGEEMHEAQREIARSPGFEPSFDALFDLTAVTNVQILAETIRVVADNTVFTPQVRRAFVTSGPAVYGLMRMLGGLLGDDRSGEIEMFQDRAAAERWLDRQ